MPDEKYISAAGKRKTIAAWAAELGLRKESIHSRISSGMSPEEAVTTPRKQRGGSLPRTMVTVDGVTRTLIAWCALNGVKVATAYNRVGMGWPLSEAVRAPLVEGRRRRSPSMGGNRNGQSLSAHEPEDVHRLSCRTCAAGRDSQKPRTKAERELRWRRELDARREWEQKNNALCTPDFA